MVNSGPWMVALPVLPLALLAFCTWAVYTGGLSALQHDCVDADSPAILSAPNTANSGTAYLGGVQGLMGFSANALPCSKVYRFWWFVMAYEIVIVTALFMAIAIGALYYTKIGFLGLFAVGLWLYIQASNDFLAVQSVGHYHHGSARQRIRATIAGAIMTAIANGLIILALGAVDSLGLHSRKHANTTAYTANTGPDYATTAAPVGGAGYPTTHTTTTTTTAAYPANTTGTAYPAPGTYPAGTGPAYAGNVAPGGYPANQAGQGAHVVAAPL